MSTMEITTIDVNRKYWFIRSQSGAYYNEFRECDYVGIGWDAFNAIELFDQLSKSQFIKKIHKEYPKVKRPGYIYEQIKRFFNDISIGDIVMVPNADSKKISFGEVLSDVYTETLEEDTNSVFKKCPFVKRRSIKWLKTVDRNELDSHLFRLVYTHGAVTSALPYAPYIDRTLHSYFIKGEKTHLVLRVTKREKVFSDELIPLLNGTNSIIKSLEEEIVGYSSGIELRVDVQSPGPAEFIFNNAIAKPVFDKFHSIFGRLNKIDEEVTDDIIDLEMELEDKLIREKATTEVAEAAKKLHVQFQEQETRG